MQRVKKRSHRDTEQQECKMSPHILFEKPFWCRLKDTEPACRPPKTPISIKSTSKTLCLGSSEVPAGPELCTALLPNSSNKWGGFDLLHTQPEQTLLLLLLMAFAWIQCFVWFKSYSINKVIKTNPAWFMNTPSISVCSDLPRFYPII